MLKPGVFSVLSFIPILLRSTAHVSLLLSLARTYNALLSLSPSLSGGCGRSEVSRSQSLIKNPDFLSGTYRAQPLGEGVARTPSPAPALRALRWPPRLSQKYARRDGVETDVCQQFVNRCHGSLSQKYARRDGVETRPYQRGERQPSPASAVVNPTSRFETRPYQRGERQSCGSPAPPAPLPRCGPCGGLHVCLRNTLGGTGLKPVPTNAMKDRAAGRSHPQPRSRAAGEGGS